MLRPLLTAKCSYLVVGSCSDRHLVLLVSDTEKILACTLEIWGRRTPVAHEVRPATRKGLSSTRGACMFRQSNPIVEAYGSRSDQK
jgi:hypothetical protein